jgi:hypothetical protein
MRDVFALYRERAERVLREDTPTFETVDVDAWARERDYNGGDPGLVADELAANAEALAAVLDKVRPEEWMRPLVRKGETRDLLWMVRHVVHEGAHHLLDIGRTLRAARGR